MNSRSSCALLILSALFAISLQAQNSAQSTTTTPGSAAAARRARELDVLKTPTKDDLLRGAYGPYRANNDLLFYALKLRVDPDTKTIKGSNTIRFRMLADGTRIQIELSPDLTIDGITFNGKPLHYERVPDTRALYSTSPRRSVRARPTRSSSPIPVIP